MRFKMPKTAYRVILGLFLLSFVASSCGNKKSKDKDTKGDTTKMKPVDGGT
jgi:hypothetical protein